MSNIDIKGITASLTGLKIGLDGLDNYKSVIQSIPQISPSIYSPDLLSGFSLSKERVKTTLDYKYDIFSELPRKVFDNKCCLSKLSMEDVLAALNRADVITANNVRDGKTLIKYGRAFTVRLWLKPGRTK